MNISEIKTYVESQFTEAEVDLKTKFDEVVAFVTGKEQIQAEKELTEKAAALAVDIQNATDLLQSNGYSVVLAGQS